MKKKVRLDADEKEILDSYERGEWKSVNPPSRDVRKYQRAARASLAKNRRINIRIPSRVLEDLQLRAVEEGIPYQTLIASILYKFSLGRLVDRAYNSQIHRISSRSTRRSR